MLANITKSFVDRLALLDAGQEVHWDLNLKGFGLVVGKTAKTYIAQRDIRGRALSRRITIGKHGPFTTAQARQRAQELLHAMARGIDPAEEERKAEQAWRAAQEADRTLRDMWLSYRATRAHKLTLKTLNDYEGWLNNNVPDWMSKPLASITVDMVQERHRRIAKSVRLKALKGLHERWAEAERSGRPVLAEERALQLERLRNGYHTADGIKMLGTIWRHARGRIPNLPDNPIERLNVDRVWFGTRRRTGVLAENDFPRFHRALQEEPNVVMRDYLFALWWTGARRGEMARLEWKWVDFERRTITFVQTKNKHVLVLPMTKFLEALLRERRLMSGGEGLVFPCQEPRGALERACKRAGLAYPLTPHDFRRTFATQCEQAGLSELMKKRLLNHVTNSGTSDVTMGYVVLQDVEMIRPRAEQVSHRMTALCGVEGDPMTSERVIDGSSARIAALQSFANHSG